MPQGRIFGEAAESYDVNRPGYSDRLVAEVVSYADRARGGRRSILEVGAGTGKATVLFARQGFPMVCVEPDPRMADVLRRNTADFPDVRVEVTDFESRRAAGERHGLFVAATCWHWFDPVRRWDLVHAALVPGGTVALVWNPQAVVDPVLHAALAEVDARHGIADSPHADLAADRSDAPHAPGAAAGDGADPDWPEPGCRLDPRFTDPRSLRLRSPRRYDTAGYVGFLDSVSVYRRLPEPDRDRVFADTARVLDSYGGGIDLDSATDIFLARKV